jgi:hypothetical protein
MKRLLQHGYCELYQRVWTVAPSTVGRPIVPYAQSLQLPRYAIPQTAV